MILSCRRFRKQKDRNEVDCRIVAYRFGFPICDCRRYNDVIGSLSAICRRLVWLILIKPSTVALHIVHGGQAVVG